MRTWLLVTACCVPTVLATGVLALRFPAAEPPAPTPAAAEPQTAGHEGAGAARLELNVAYAGDAGNLPEGAAVFVFARRAGETMPVAVEKLDPAELPATVTLAVPAEPETAFEVVARLSASGGVRGGAGREASSGPLPGALLLDPSRAPLALEIPAG